MNEQGFSAYLTPRLGTDSVKSYLSYCRRVETTLGIDLDATVLTATAMAGIKSGMERLPGTFAVKSISNCMSAVRSYAAFVEQLENPAALPVDLGRARKPDLKSMPMPPISPARSAPPDFIRDATVKGLLVLHGQIMDELRDRGIVRTGNGPVGDYAEVLFARAFGWTLETNSATGFDATDAAGVRYQIKSRRVTARNPSRQLGALRRLPDHNFDVLAAVLFDENYAVRRAALIPHSEVVTGAKFMAHTNSWRFMLDDRVWGLSGVCDVTAEITEAQLAAYTHHTPDTHPPNDIAVRIRVRYPFPFCTIQITSVAMTSNSPATPMPRSRFVTWVSLALTLSTRQPWQLDLACTRIPYGFGLMGSSRTGGYFMKLDFLARAVFFMPCAAIAQTVPGQVAFGPAPVAPIAAPSTVNAVLRTGTEVPLRLREQLTTKGKELRVGQRFQMETAENIMVNGITVIPSGSPAIGEITDVRNKGMWGKSGHLGARILYVTVNGRQIRLSGSFDDKGVTGTGAVVGAIAFLPIAGFFTTGTSAKVSSGSAVKGFIDEDVPLQMAAATPAALVVGTPVAPMAVAATTPTAATALDKKVSSEAIRVPASVIDTKN